MDNELPAKAFLAFFFSTSFLLCVVVYETCIKYVNHRWSQTMLVTD